MSYLVEASRVWLGGAAHRGIEAAILGSGQASLDGTSGDDEHGRERAGAAELEQARQKKGKCVGEIILCQNWLHVQRPHFAEAKPLSYLSQALV